MAVNRTTSLGEERWETTILGDAIYKYANLCQPLFFSNKSDERHDGVMINHSCHVTEYHVLVSQSLTTGAVRRDPSSLSAKKHPNSTLVVGRRGLDHIRIISYPLIASLSHAPLV